MKDELGCRDESDERVFGSASQRSIYVPVPCQDGKELWILKEAVLAKDGDPNSKHGQLRSHL